MLTPAKAFGLVLRQLRTEKGISQERLALEGGMDRTFISLLERGLRQPSLTTLIQLSKILDVTASEMIAKVEIQLAENPNRENHENC